jgi:hypothetical protein
MSTLNDTLIEKITKVARQAEDSFPGSTTELTNFPSGAIMLDVRWHNRLFVLAYFPTHGFGVDEVGDEGGFDMAFSFISPHLEAAAEEIHRRLKSA